MNWSQEDSISWDSQELDNGYYAMSLSDFFIHNNGFIKYLQVLHQFGRFRFQHGVLAMLQGSHSHGLATQADECILAVTRAAAQSVQTAARRGGRVWLSAGGTEIVHQCLNGHVTREFGQIRETGAQFSLFLHDAEAVGQDGQSMTVHQLKVLCFHGRSFVDTLSGHLSFLVVKLRALNERNESG